MIRGALILAIGYIAGYSHAAAHNDEITKTVQDVKKAWAEASESTTEDTGETSETSDTPEGEIAP